MSFFLAFLHRQFIYKPPDPQTSFQGKTVVITGANIGLGKEAALKIVKLGATTVILACRNVDRGKVAAAEIQKTTGCSRDVLQVWQLDMSSYQSVIAFGDRVNAELSRLDTLLANAGLGFGSFRKSQQGHEEMLQTNVLSCFLHILLLYPRLHETAVKFNTTPHITVTASELYEVAKFKEAKLASAGELLETMDDEKQSVPADRYNVTKLMEILLVKKLAELLPLESGKVVINCVAPGFCQTGLAREHDSLFARFLIKILARPAEVGSRTLVYGASAGLESHGQYVPDTKITTTRGLTGGTDGVKLKERVWQEVSAELERVRPSVTMIEKS